MRGFTAGISGAQHLVILLEECNQNAVCQLVNLEVWVLLGLLKGIKSPSALKEVGDRLLSFLPSHFDVKLQEIRDHFDDVLEESLVLLA